MELQKITDHISLIEGKNCGRFPFSHSFIIEDDVTVLIDTGCGIEILAQLEKVDMVMNSHSHPDHASGNWLFPGSPLIVPEEEIDYNSNIRKLSVRYAGKKLSRVWIDFVTKEMNFRNANPMKSYHDGQVLTCGDTSIEAVHTPGHTAGHYCFFERNDKILFSFDIDFTQFGPWYGHEESDIGQFKASIERAKTLKPEIVVSSHRGIIKEDITGEFEKFAKKFEERDERILKVLDRERTLREMVDQALIYRDFSFHPLLLRYWEEMMVRKHLEDLIKRGVVARTRKGFVKNV